MIYSTIASTLCKDKPISWLDLCAAPGGKTTAVAGVLPKGSLIVANEFSASRTAILRENMIKWGYPDTIICNSTAAGFAASHILFDVVAVDAPCSGEGMMRKDEEARQQWSNSLVQQCASLQREILTNAWQCVKPGGWLVYSTCTFNRIENEENAEWLSQLPGAEPFDTQLPQEWGIHSGIATSLPCLRFMPHITKGEGLFVCIMHKAKETVKNMFVNNHHVKHQRTEKLPVTPSWLRLPEQYELSEINGIINAYPTHCKSYLYLLRQHCNVKSVGVEICTLKGRNIIPSHHAAMCGFIDNSVIPTLDISKADALRYLHREAITTLDKSMPRGHMLLYYAGLPLGFVKNIGNRLNNLYPQEWRIRTL